VLCVSNRCASSRFIRRSKGREFAVTVAPVWQYHQVRSDFLDYFEGVDTYCIGLEYNHANGNCNLHAYLKFNRRRGCVDVIEACFPEGTINVQSCKSSRNWLKYITKEDVEPLYNCKVRTVRSMIRETRRQRRTDGTFPLISAHQFLYIHTFITIQ
jgi:hypothetical protein